MGAKRAGGDGVGRKRSRTAEADRVEEFHCDVRKMINNSEFSDVVFVCKDGGRVHASRLLLTARSQFFERMLSNGMAESQRSEIALQVISSADLLPVMEFLYTGALKQHVPEDWKSAFDIILASRIFLLGGLEAIALEYLQTSTSRARIDKDPEQVVRLLSTAVTYVSDLGESVEALLCDLVCVITDVLEPKHLHLLSPGALLYCLEATKANPAARPSITEFVRFRNMVAWCACKEFAQGEQLAQPALPPEIKLTLKLLDRPPREQLRLSSLSPKESNVLHKILGLTALVEMYLPYVNFAKIPTDHYTDIVGELYMIFRPNIHDVPAFDAMTVLYPDTRNLEARKDIWWETWMDDGQYKICSTGPQIHKRSLGGGFARCNIPMIVRQVPKERIYEWEVTIEEVFDDFVEIGVHCLREEDDNGRTFCTLSAQPNGWALRIDPKNMYVSRGVPKGREKDSVSTLTPFGDLLRVHVYGKDYGHNNSKIKVRLESGKLSSCSFAMDGKDLGTAWSDLPDGIYYPAVSLGSASTGAVRMRLLKDVKTDSFLFW